MEAEYRPIGPTKRLKYALAQAPSRPALAPDTPVTFLRMEAIGETGEIDTSERRPLEDVSSGFTRFAEGDVVVAKITPCFENGKGAVIRDMEYGVGFGTTELHVLTPSQEMDARFLYYVTASTEFRRLGEAAMTGAAGQKRVPEEFVRDFRIWLPDLNEQRCIANYLDTETAQIDALIAEKRRLLALLEEKRSALVSRAVTRGLDPDAPLKPSGLEWLGEIPAHWQVIRAKQLFHVRDERSETGDEELLTVSHITGVTPRSEKQVFMFRAEDMTGYKRCEPGDLVVNTLWAWMGAMGVAAEAGIVSPDYHVYTPIGELKPAFIEALCRSKPFVAEVISHSKGVWSSRLRLYPEAFLDIRLPVPPPDEQDAIVAMLSRERMRTVELEATLNQSVALLDERRSALITAAVTGQLTPESISA